VHGREGVADAVEAVGVVAALDLPDGVRIGPAHVHRVGVEEETGVIVQAVLEVGDVPEDVGLGRRDGHRPPVVVVDVHVVRMDADGVEVAEERAADGFGRGGGDVGVGG
jgi:hypothetical protein